MNGTDLLAQFRENRSETAFRELVRHYTNLVYSVAKRRLWDGFLAQEVTQLVFIRLAKAAPNISGDAQLVAWLHRTTVHVAIDLWRSETRRRAREEHAAVMQQPDCPENAVWNEVAPVLDEAMDKLTDSDRQAILLRFFEEKTMRDVGEVLGISEDAAKMRVSRAIERLRAQLSAQGVTCTALALTTMLVEHSVEAAPASLTAILALLKVPVSASAAAGGILGGVLNASKMQIAAGITALLSGGIAVVCFHSMSHASDSPKAEPQAIILRTNLAKSNSLASLENPTAAPGDSQPSAIELLHAVVQARQRIASGSIEFEASFHSFEGPPKNTNQSHIKAIFDGAQRRFEKVGHQFAYVGVGEVSETNRAKMEESGMDHEAGVKAGLLEQFEAKTVNIYDGSRILSYTENDGRPQSAYIYDAKSGSQGEYLFDPRCLGLSTYFSPNETPETALNLTQAKSISTIGKENLDGVPTWHVRVIRHDMPFDLWVDAAHPERVRKLTWNTDVIFSKFDESHPTDLIPVEVRGITYKGDGSIRFERRIVRTALKLNEPVDPVSWTLAGLNMAIGANVCDTRISRSIGYWDGTGLLDHPPRKDETNTIPAQASPDLGKLLALLKNKPTSPEAFDAAIWILLNTPDGPEVDKAAEVIEKYHFANADLLDLCQQLQRFRHRSSTKLLEAILQKNPDTEIQANACFTLATLLKVEADNGNNKKATAEAEKYFDRVIKQYGQMKGARGNDLAELAKPELSELRHLIVGKPAPQTEGKDLDGREFKLSDYRGKVVILVFWVHNCRPDFRYLRDLLERQAGKPLAIVGVYCDANSTEGKAIAEESGLTWRS